MDNEAKQDITVRLSGNDLQSRTERYILYYEILLRNSETRHPSLIRDELHDLGIINDDLRAHPRIDSELTKAMTAQLTTRRMILNEELEKSLDSVEQIEATIEVCKSFNGLSNVGTFDLDQAYMDTLQIEPEPENPDVKTAIITKISKSLKDAGYEILNSENPSQGD